jgi:hypothetical protein
MQDNVILQTANTITAYREMPFLSKHTTMDTFYDRLLREGTELSERILKLAEFLQSGKAQDIDPKQLSLLRIQIQAMQTYHQILRERIALIETESIHRV